eukprot:280724-Amphidinium_carterae.1
MAGSKGRDRSAKERSDRSLSRAVAHEDKLKQRKDSKADEQDRRSASPARTIPASPSDAPASKPMLGASPKKQGKPVESQLEEAVPPISQVDAPPRSVSASKRVRLPDEAGGVAVKFLKEHPWMRRWTLCCR